MTLAALRFLLLGILAAAIATLVYAVASAPSRTPNYLGNRGLRRVRALQQSPFFAQIEPFLRWLAMRLSSLVGDAARLRLDRLLTGAGDVWGLVPEEVIALCLLGGGAGLTAGVAYGVFLGNGLLYVALGAGTGAFVPWYLISSLVTERQARVRQGLAGVIDLVSLGLSAGLDFPGAIGQVVDKSSNPNDPLIEELNLLLQELQIGKTRKQALVQFAQRMPIEPVKEFVGAIIQAEEHGNPLAEVLVVQADAVRVRRSVRAEELASKAGVKLIIPMSLLLLSVMILIVAPLLMDAGNIFP